MNAGTKIMMRLEARRGSIMDKIVLGWTVEANDAYKKQKI